MNCSICKFSYDNKSGYLCPSCGGYEKVNLFSEIPIYVSFLQNLINKTATLIDKLKAKNIPEDDVRREKLGAFNILTLATLFDLKDYDGDIRYSDSRIPSIIAGNNPRLTHTTIQKIVENIDIRNKISYLVISLFQFENLFTQLAKNKGFTGEENYSNVVRFVVENSNIENKSEKLNALLLPSIVRNTLHSGGIYKHRNKKDIEIKINNISFKFEINKYHDYSSWRGIIFYFNNIIDIMYEILEIESTTSFQKSQRS